MDGIDDGRVDRCLMSGWLLGWVEGCGVCMCMYICT